MKNIAYLIVLFIIISCKKDSDRIEIDNIDGYKVEKKFKNNTLVSSKTYDGDMLIWEILYNKNGIVKKATEFYPTGSIKSVSTLQKEPNYYYDIEIENQRIVIDVDNQAIKSEIKDYYPSGKPKIETKLIWSEDNQNYYIEKAYYTNGKLEYEGEVNIINDKKYRRGWWIFYTKEGKAKLMLEFINEGKIEIENQRIVIDVDNQAIKKNDSHFFEKKIIEKNKDSIKVNIKYFSPDTILGNILYIIDNEGNELKQKTMIGILQ